MAQPAIRTTVVGSYPVPEWLVALPSEQALRDATAVVFKTQELAGIDLVVDGELYRFDINEPDTNGMIDYFVRQMGGIRWKIGREDLRRARETPGLAYRSAPAGVVESAIEEGSLNLPRDYRRARALTTMPLKFTVTGPHMLSKLLLDTHYRDPAALAQGIAAVLARQVAEIDADVIQVDEANIPGAPEEAEWAAEAINVVLDAIPGEKAVHICFGNYGGQTIQQGTWRALVAFMNRLHADHLVLEFAHRGYAELEYLRELDARLGIGLGVVDIKSNVVETAEMIARRLEQAERVLGPGRVRYLHPDCGFWMLKRSVADAKMRALVAGRDLYLGL